jgi:endonuclease/exonuclease/phosphatase (EEP) superfamily protein YafD
MFARKQVIDVQGVNIQDQIKLFTANVYQKNRAYDRMLEQIRQEEPEVIFLLETDKLWEKAMDVLIADYPYCLKEPLDNTYGLLFYSKLPIIEGAIGYLVEGDVPSIEVTLQLPSGQLVKAWGLHPKPPVPGEDNRSTAKDKEIMKIAFKAKEEKLPIIVMGDLNDVAWSHVTELFTKTSGLLDPRIGRGFYSTFSANHWYLRFPLDYVFCSSHFGLISMKKLAHNGSDHFAMCSHFEFQSELAKVQKKPTAKADDIKEAARKAKQPVKHD